jgi:hypothetical protein
MTLEHYRPQIEAALSYAGGSHSFSDVERGVNERRMQPWYGPNSVLITELDVKPGRKYLSYFLAGGNLDEIERMVPVVEEWGREQGCTREYFTGRRGWERTFLTKTGWRPELVVFQKEL